MITFGGGADAADGGLTHHAAITVSTTANREYGLDLGIVVSCRR
jgi:hypothetical protein